MARIIVDDCREAMAAIEPNSVDAVVTDPPYGLGFMGKEWDRLSDQRFHETWAREAYRVLKPGGHLLAFSGTRTSHRMVCAIEDAGFEIRDSIVWMFGQGFPKSHNIGDGRGTALKPAHEPICVARKPLTSTVAANVERWGTGALNIAATRIGTDHISAHGGGRNGAGRIYGGGVGVPAIEAGSNPHTGRWPANVALDDEAAAMLDQQSGERTSGKMRPTRTTAGVNGRNAYGKDRADGFTTMETYGDTGGASRFFYVAKASRAERNAGLAGMPERSSGTMQDDNYTWTHDGKGNRINLDTRAANHHPCVKPVALMRWLVRLVTPPGGLVLDPFTGSGSTGIACVLEGFAFLGIEQDEDYAEIARRRIAHAERHGEAWVKAGGSKGVGKTNTYGHAKGRKVQVCDRCDRRWHSGAAACETCGGPLEWRDKADERERRRSDDLTALPLFAALEGAAD